MVVPSYCMPMHNLLTAGCMAVPGYRLPMHDLFMDGSMVVLGSHLTMSNLLMASCMAVLGYNLPMHDLLVASCMDVSGYRMPISRDLNGHAHTNRLFSRTPSQNQYLMTCRTHHAALCAPFDRFLTCNDLNPFSKLIQVLQQCITQFQTFPNN
ncbi:hypothetical protein L1987_49274 [Smallanthus sonchifolius]|uniref:Uncharacterized protein n=1 Tax=Smallanthus sonchifolius TaxID=185202 RepID=A0ACB9FTM0_9ASTR|nr:hypothetical protein L1987_49274 [Smallanthus sonchifolius]